MKRFILLFSIILTSICTASAQFSAKKYNVDDISGIRAGWSFMIELESGDSNEITVIAPAQTIECVVVKKEDGVISFDLDFSKVTTKSNYPNGIRNVNNEILMTKGRKTLKGPIKVKMQLPKLEAVILSGNAQLITKGTFKEGKLICTLSGSSAVTDIKIAADEFKADIKGNSKAVVSGSYREISVDMGGNGSLNISGDFYKGDITQNGTSNLLLNGKSNSLTISLAAASQATLIGNTQNLKIENSGNGKIDCNKFSTRSASLTLSGASGTDLHVLQSLKAKVSGAARLKYDFKGDTSKLQIQKFDAATVNRF